MFSLRRSCSQLNRTLWRRKPIGDCGESKLARVLSVFDLTALGVGSTLGVGVYVLAGNVSKNIAGPAVVLSFLIAAIASTFAGFCYAEFGARVPKAGSAYIYSYVTIGEFIAFLIGWNLILEYSIGSASVVRALSTYLDALFDNVMAKFLRDHIPINVTGFSEYPDIFAFVVTMLFAVAIAFGAKESSAVNNVFTMINLLVVGLVIFVGLFMISLHNWKIPQSELPSKTFGTGGFMPYGLSGVIKGAAICFYGFIGFDCIATAGEEARNPRRSIPIAIITSLVVIFVAYFGVSTVLTMMLPYYAQDEDAPLPHVFRECGLNWIAHVITVGALFGLCASLMGAMFPLPRIVFALASDGLLFEWLGRIHSQFQTPFIGTLLTGFLTAILGAIFNLSQLINMLSIGTLVAYTVVACCVLVLRYSYDLNDRENVALQETLGSRHLAGPTKMTSQLVILCVIIYCIGSFFLAGILVNNENTDTDPWSLVNLTLTIITGVVLAACLVVISLQPAARCELSFKVPLVPWLPGSSILINIYLMLKLDIMTWIRFVIWIVIGLLIYIFYSVRNSKLRLRTGTWASMQCLVHDNI